MGMHMNKRIGFIVGVLVAAGLWWVGVVEKDQFWPQTPKPPMEKSSVAGQEPAAAQTDGKDTLPSDTAKTEADQPTAETGTPGTGLSGAEEGSAGAQQPGEAAPAPPVTGEKKAEKPASAKAGPAAAAKAASGAGPSEEAPAETGGKTPIAIPAATTPAAAAEAASQAGPTEKAPAETGGKTPKPSAAEINPPAAVEGTPVQNAPETGAGIEGAPPLPGEESTPVMQKDYIWKPFTLRDKAEGFAHFISMKSTVPCEVEKTGPGEFRIFITYKDQQDLKTKRSLIEAVGISIETNN
jgi:hypothetical protein